MRWFAVTALVVLGLVGCGQSGEPSKSADATTDASPAATRIGKCVERFLLRVSPESGARTSEHELRRYVETTYCERFESHGWVYEDGALSIGAQTWLKTAGSEECATATAGPGQASKTIPCEELRPREAPRRIECALLHHVRKSEVREYLENLRSQNELECDDGTPLDELGAP